jgi:hypothetical protein
MTPQEASALLAVAAAFDNRKPDPDAAMAWSLALTGLPFIDCRNAIVDHYRRTTEWLMPAHVLELVKRVRDKRIADHSAELTPPPECREGDAHRDWLREAKRRLGDGEPVEAIAWTDPDATARHLPDLRRMLPAPAVHPERSEGAA